MNKLSSTILKGRLPLERAMSATGLPVVKHSYPEPRSETGPETRPEIKNPTMLPVATPAGPPYCRYSVCRHHPFCQDKLDMCFGNWDGGWRE